MANVVNKNSFFNNKGKRLETNLKKKTQKLLKRWGINIDPKKKAVTKGLCKNKNKITSNLFTSFHKGSKFNHFKNHLTGTNNMNSRAKLQRKVSGKRLKPNVDKNNNNQLNNLIKNKQAHLGGNKLESFFRAAKKKFGLSKTNNALTKQVQAKIPGDIKESMNVVNLLHFL